MGIDSQKANESIIGLPGDGGAGRLPGSGRTGVPPSERETSPVARRSPWDILTPCWDVIGPSHADPQRALAVVCQWYWFPVYAFIRSLGVGAEEARDVTQGFFAGVLERNDLARLDPARGRFRSWLRTAAKRHLYNELDRARAKKRGRALTISIDALSAEERLRMEATLSPLASDASFDRHWALMVIERTIGRPRDFYAAKGKAELFAQLEDTLAAGEAELNDAQLGVRLGKSAGAVRQERHRMRNHYRRFLRHEVGLTVRSPHAVDDEIRRLLVALS